MVRLLFISFITALALYAVIFWRLTRSKGLDPSLITYANPLSTFGYAPFKLCLVGGGLAIFNLAGAGGFLLGLVLFCSLLNIFFLTAFGRLPTQPAFYLGSSALLAFVLLVRANAYTASFAGALFILQEIYLWSWRRQNRTRYDHWVEKKALRIWSAYPRVFSDLPEPVKFAVLHIATTEDIARPTIVRLAERVYFALKHPPVISTGIMQVAAPQPVSDEQSLRLGATIVADSLALMPKALVDTTSQIKWLAKHYNGSTTYGVYLEQTYPGSVMAWQRTKSSLNASAKAPRS